VSALLFIAAFFAFVWLVWIYIHRPVLQFPPLAFANDDPEMIAARKEAQNTIEEFLTLYKQYPDGAGVKVPFLSSSGETEYLAAEVVRIDLPKIKVLLTSPPVSHEGPVERSQVFDLKELADWIIILPNNKRKGGFTMRLMFKKAREQWGELPPELVREEKAYKD